MAVLHQAPAQEGLLALADVITRRVRLIEQEGEPVSLIESENAADEAVVVDAVSSGSAPGTLYRFDVTDAPLPAEVFPSTHAMGLDPYRELTRAS